MPPPARAPAQPGKDKSKTPPKARAQTSATASARAAKADTGVCYADAIWSCKVILLVLRLVLEKHAPRLECWTIRDNRLSNPSNASRLNSRKHPPTLRDGWKAPSTCARIAASVRATAATFCASAPPSEKSRLNAP